MVRWSCGCIRVNRCTVNEGTRTYNAVQTYLHENESHVLLLTATPYNLKYGDVANQLALFLDEDEDLGLTPEFALQRNPNLYENLEMAHSTLAAFRKSDEPEDWKRLMGEHLVRRTRSFVLNTYAQEDAEGRKYLEFKNPDGSVSSRFTFPKRKAIPVNHVFDEDDAGLVKISLATVSRCASTLTSPRPGEHRYRLKFTWRRGGHEADSFHSAGM